MVVTSWTRRLAPSASLDQNVRTALWVVALSAVVGTLAVVLSSGLDPAHLAAALAGVAFLAVHWGRSRRVVRVRWGGDVLDALAIAVVAVALPDSTQVLTVPTAGALLRSVRPGRLLALARVGLYCLAIGAGPVAAGAQEGALALAEAGVLMASVVPGLLFATLLALVLGTALVRTERGADRDRALALGGTRLISASTAGEVLTGAQRVATGMTATVRGVEVRVVASTLGRAGVRQGPADDEVHVVPFGARAEDGRLEVRGPYRATAEVMPALMVLAQQVGLALQKCRALEELRERAETDGLTGLASAQTFRERLRTQVVRTAGQDDREHRGTLLVVDCDDFKTVNDTYGHLVGDAVLREIARRLRTDSRSGDVVARLGGDEFAVLLAPDPTRETTARVERLTALLSRPVGTGGHEVAISCSVGSAPVLAGRSLEDLVRAADSAMYTAKATGKGRHMSSESIASRERAASTAASGHVAVLESSTERVVALES